MVHTTLKVMEESANESMRLIKEHWPEHSAEYLRCVANARAMAAAIRFAAPLLSAVALEEIDNILKQGVHSEGKPKA